MKRETKAQRREREIAALERRLTDIFIGACGCLPDPDQDLVAHRVQHGHDGRGDGGRR